MAYTNGIFYVDYELGSKANRNKIVPTVYANNGSGLVRVTAVAHELSTGKVISIWGTTSSVYVGNWTITRIDADNFDLDSSTYTSNPASKGSIIRLA